MHTVIYFIGIVIFVILFVIERFTGIFSKLIGALYGIFDEAGSSDFSNNIFEELSPEDQRLEYAATNTSSKHVEYRIYKGDAADKTDLYKYYKERPNSSLMLETVNNWRQWS